MRVVALVLAAGQGRRMGAETNKPYLLLAGKPILFHTLHEFEECPSIDEVALITEKHEIDHARTSMVDDLSCSKITSIVPGGLKRQDSVWEGIKAIEGDCELVMVHDGVRPFISQLLLQKAVDATRESGATVVAVPVKDTIKRVQNNIILETLRRDELWQIQKIGRAHV